MRSRQQLARSRPAGWTAVALVAVFAFVSADLAKATTLVGTVVTGSSETIAEMNALIEDYNTDFLASLELIDDNGFIDKLEDSNNEGEDVGDSGADFINGQLLTTDFDFFIPGSGTDSLNIFDSGTITFTASGLGPGAFANSFSGIDSNVHAFDYNGSTAFEYYVAKDGSDGWSLWLAMDGLNPVYTDEGTSGTSSMTGTGFTRGDITDTNLAYDPVNKGVSHISFYSINPIPEPSTAILLGIGIGFISVFGARIRRIGG